MNSSVFATIIFCGRKTSVRRPSEKGHFWLVLEAHRNSKNRACATKKSFTFYEKCSWVSIVNICIIYEIVMTALGANYYTNVNGRWNNTKLPFKRFNIVWFIILNYAKFMWMLLVQIHTPVKFFKYFICHNTVAKECACQYCSLRLPHPLDSRNTENK